MVLGDGGDRVREAADVWLLWEELFGGGAGEELGDEVDWLAFGSEFDVHDGVHADGGAVPSYEWSTEWDQLRNHNV